MGTPSKQCRASWALMLTPIGALAASCGLGGPAAKHVAPASLAEAANGRPQPVDEMGRTTPMDPAVRTGKLANGLTYYVLKHDQPGQRAALWLAVKAGSVLEDDDQRGLAHFVEHMAFNGTRRFPRGDIEHFMGRAGMRIGADINARTTFDQTVYQLTVPTDDRAVMYRGLDVLRDMAGDVMFDEPAVDKERSVVLEEWRLKQGATARMVGQQFPILLQGSRYADRLPIGLPNIIKDAKSAALLRFYHDWYRPELMAVIAVGDFDPAEMEAEIKSRFGDLSNSANSPQRVAFPVPHEQDLAITIATDAEIRFTTASVIDKVDHRTDQTKSDYRRNLIERLYHEMLRARLNERAGEPNSPLVSARASRQMLTPTTDAILRSVVAKEGRLESALQLLFREIARLERYGFLPSEIERARKNLVVRTERSALERQKAPLGALASEMVRNFVDHDQMPGPDVELAWARELAPGITLEELNERAQFRRGVKGRVIVIDAPANTQTPAETRVRAIVKASLENLGSLPSKGKHEHWKDLGIEYPRGKVEHTVVAGGEPKSLVLIGFTGAGEWRLDAERDAWILKTALDIRLRELLRQDMNGVYGVVVGAEIKREPTPRHTWAVSFGCAPENVGKLRDAVFAELAAIAKNGIDDATLATVIAQLRRQHEVDVKNNGWWLRRLTDAYYFGEDFAQANDIDAITTRATSENVRATMRRMFNDKEYIFVVLRPAGPSRDASPGTAPPPDDAAPDQSIDEPPP